MLNPPCSNSRIVTTIISGVEIFSIVMVSGKKKPLKNHHNRVRSCVLEIFFSLLRLEYFKGYRADKFQTTQVCLYSDKPFLKIIGICCLKLDIWTTLYSAKNQRELNSVSSV